MNQNVSDTFLKKLSARDDAAAIYCAAAIFAAGTALVLIFNGLGFKESATAIVTILVIPLLAYAVLSGKISEFSAPGGFSAKFKAATQQNIDSASTKLSDRKKQLLTIEKGTAADLKTVISQTKKGEPIALILRFGRADYYQAQVTETYLDHLRDLDPELIVIVVDDISNEFVAMIDASSFLSLSREEEQALVNAIGDRKLNFLRQFPQFRFKAISEGQTNAEALRLMNAENTKTLVVLDPHNKPTAVIKREDIVAHIIEKLTTG